MLPKAILNFAQERDFERKNDEILRMLRTGARFSSKFSGCSARERDFFVKIFRTHRAGAPFSSKFRGCSARKCDFLQNKATLGGAFWSKIGIEPIP